MRLGVARALVNGSIVDGDIDVIDGIVANVGLHPAAGSGLAVPGFIDLQVNGFAGVDFAAASAEDYRIAAAAMAATGVTAFQPTFICLPGDRYPPVLAAVATAQQQPESPRLLGAHLEGPFLSPARPGAHDPANMLEPSIAAADQLLASGPVSCMTVAPERPGALALIDHLVGEGLTVAIGHSDADAATAHSAIDTGATLVTHLFNAQRPWRHRDPGIAGAALVRNDVAVSVILDGHHLAAETVEMIRRCAPGRMVLITDAIAAAGQPDGAYSLGDRTVIVTDGLAHLENGTIAGSVLTMDGAVRNLLTAGATLVEAIEAATLVPARVIGRPELGTIAPGTPADIAVLDDELRVTRTLVAGVEIGGQ